MKLLLAIVVLGTFMASGQGSDKNVLRLKRSPVPGLFGGITVPSVPTLLRPLTLDDLAEFRTKFDTLAGLTKGIEKAFEEEKKLRTSFQGMLLSMKDKVSALENSVTPDDTNFWGESETCGGVVVAQTGRVSYKKNGFFSDYERCVWTVQANHRSSIKVFLTTAYFDKNGFDSVSVTELNDNAAKGHLKTTILTPDKRYVFKGPVILISFLTDGSDVGEGFSVEYEGTGRSILLDTKFQHFHIDNWFGTFSSENATAAATDAALNKPELPQSDQPKTNKSKNHFITIVLNPHYQNVTQIKVKLNGTTVEPKLKESDCDKSVVKYYEDFLVKDSTAKRCCGGKCVKTEFLNNDGLFLAVVESKGDTAALDNFQFSWEIDTEIPPVDSVDTCGGMLTGRYGKISYMEGKEYKDNERCVWVIHPTEKSHIKLKLSGEDFEDGYDFVTVTTVPEEASDSDPTSITLQKNNVYKLSGPVILVTFYSDGTSRGSGFTLVWEDAGSNLKDEESPIEISYFETESGSEQVKVASPLNRAIVINPKYLDGSSLNLKLTKLETQSVYLWGSDHANFSVAKTYEGHGGKINFSPEGFGTVDGIFVLIFHPELKLGSGDINFLWEKGTKATGNTAMTNQHAEQTEGCGGILVGDTGKIEYKLDSTYANNERCTWVIHTSQMSKISFRLVKDGFESCCDYLLSSPLDPKNGSLGNGFKITREESLRSFVSQVAFITFFSDGSVGDHGFSLEFTSSIIAQDHNIEKFHYTHEVFRETNGTVRIPSENEILEVASNEIKIFVLSPEPIISHKKETNITVNISNFGVDESCNADSLNFFNSPFHGQESFSKTYSCLHYKDHVSEDGCTCGADSAEIHDEFTIPENRAFIAIFKSVKSTNGKTKAFSFDWSATSEEPEAETQESTTAGVASN